MPRLVSYWTDAAVFALIKRVLFSALMYHLLQMTIGWFVSTVSACPITTTLYSEEHCV